MYIRTYICVFMYVLLSTLSAEAWLAAAAPFASVMGHRSSLSACPPQKNEPPQNRFRKFAANANAGVAANVIDAHEDQAKRQSPASDKTENGKTQNEAAPGSCKTVVWLCWPFSCSFASCMCVFQVAASTTATKTLTHCCGSDASQCSAAQ